MLKNKLQKMTIGQLSIGNSSSTISSEIGYLEFSNNTHQNDTVSGPSIGTSSSTIHSNNNHLTNLVGVDKNHRSGRLQKILNKN